MLSHAYQPFRASVCYHMPIKHKITIQGFRMLSHAYQKEIFPKVSGIAVELAVVL